MSIHEKQQATVPHSRLFGQWSVSDSGGPQFDGQMQVVNRLQSKDRQCFTCVIDGNGRLLVNPGGANCPIVGVKAYCTIHIAGTELTRAMFGFTSSVCDDMSLCDVFMGGIGQCDAIKTADANYLKVLLTCLLEKGFTGDSEVDVAFSDYDELLQLVNSTIPALLAWAVELQHEAGSLDATFLAAAEEHQKYVTLFTEATDVLSKQIGRFLNAPISLKSRELVREIFEHLDDLVNHQVFSDAAQRLRVFHRQMAQHKAFHKLAPELPLEYLEQCSMRLDSVATKLEGLKEEFLKSYCSGCATSEVQKIRLVWTDEMFRLIQEMCVRSRECWLTAFFILTSRRVSQIINVSSIEDLHLLLKDIATISQFAYLALPAADPRKSVVKKYYNSNLRRSASIGLLQGECASDVSCEERVAKITQYLADDFSRLGDSNGVNSLAPAGG